MAFEIRVESLRIKIDAILIPIPTQLINEREKGLNKEYSDFENQEKMLKSDFFEREICVKFATITGVAEINE